MSNAEHLIENALAAIHENKDSTIAWNKFSEDYVNKNMSEVTGIKLEYVWDMAQYVVLSWKHNIF